MDFKLILELDTQLLFGYSVGKFGRGVGCNDFVWDGWGWYLTCCSLLGRRGSSPLEPCRSLTVKRCFKDCSNACCSSRGLNFILQRSL